MVLTMSSSGGGGRNCSLHVYTKQWEENKKVHVYTMQCQSTSTPKQLLKERRVRVEGAEGVCR